MKMYVSIVFLLAAALVTNYLYNSKEPEKQLEPEKVSAPTPETVKKEFEEIFNTTYESSELCSKDMNTVTTAVIEDPVKLAELVHSIDKNCSFALLGAYMMDVIISENPEFPPPTKEQQDKLFAMIACLTKFRTIIEQNGAQMFPIFQMTANKITAARAAKGEQSSPSEPESKTFNL